MANIPLSSHDITALLQRAEIEHLVRQIRAIRKVDPARYGGARSWLTSYGAGARSTALNEGEEVKAVLRGATSEDEDEFRAILTIRSLPDFEGKLNRTAFLGGHIPNGAKQSQQRQNLEEMTGQEWSATIQALERIYRQDDGADGAFEAPVHFIMPEFGSGYAGAEVGGFGQREMERLTECLRERGYEEKLGIEHFFYILPADPKEGKDGESRENGEDSLPGQDIDGITVTLLSGTADRATFPALSAIGFASDTRSPAFLTLLAELAVQRPETILFQARIAGVVAGTAGMAIFELDDARKVAYLYIDSTMPEYRGRGVHTVLLRERARVARELGCVLVTGAANRGTGSARNFERSGFERGFGSTVWVMGKGEGFEINSGGVEGNV